MEPGCFRVNMQRLRNEWKNSFGEEKTQLFWNKLKHLPDEFMEDATNEFIANRRAAPILNDFFSYQDEFAKRQTEKSARDRAVSMGTFTADALNEVYNPENYTDPEIRARIKGRIELLGQKQCGKISNKIFQEGLDFYDQCAADQKGVSVKTWRQMA